MRRTLLIFFCLLLAQPAWAQTSVPPFSSLKPGQPLPPALRFIGLPKIKHNEVSLVDDHGTTVLRVDSNHSAGSVALPFSVSPGKTPLLSWRWKVSRVLDTADMEARSGDDFAARVYVFFDVPLETLSFIERARIRIARIVAGPDVPTAALVYVWDNRHHTGYAHASPFTKSVQKFVLRSGPAHVGEWMNETRDVAADFRLAFGGEPPRVTAVAVGNDTDQTGEQVSTWFGDFRFGVK